MGIYSRDYVRDSSGGRHGWNELPVCTRLIIVTVAIFFLQQIFPTLDDWFDLSLASAKQGQVWRFVTYAFLHDRFDVWHLLFNMLGLWYFGREVENIYGAREFTFFYLASAVVAGAGFVVWQAMTAPREFQNIPVVGASGAVLAVMTLFASHYPYHKIGILYGLIFIEARWVVVIYAIVDLLPVMRQLSGEPELSSVAHAAHLLGIAFGWLYFRNGWRVSNGFNFSFLTTFPRRWRQSRTRQSVRVFAPEPESPADLEAEVDRILAKIHEQGSGSLTEREQATLTKASRQFKSRL